MTKNVADFGCVVYNKFSGEKYSLVVYDPKSSNSEIKNSCAPNREIGRVKSIKSLIRVVGEGAHIKNVLMLEAKANLKVNVKEKQTHYIKGKSGTSYKLQHVAFNKPIKIFDVDNIFLGCSVFQMDDERISQGVVTPVGIGCPVHDDLKNIFGIVVRISGMRYFVAKLDEQFHKDWSFSEPPDFQISKKTMNTLIGAHAQIKSRRDGDY